MEPLLATAFISKMTYKSITQLESKKGPETSPNLNNGNKCYIGKGAFFDLPESSCEDECAISAGAKFDNICIVADTNWT